MKCILSKSNRRFKKKNIKNKDIINIETMQSNQSKTVRSRKPAKYVLETKAGFFENKSIKNLNEIINYE